ncbi:MAG: hypothetical protein AB7P07_11245 [Hyphomonadaceae bacterium]
MLATLAFAIFQAAAGAPADQPPPAQQVQVAPAVAAESDSVQERRERHALRCRNRPVMGTRIQQRVCMSRADEEEQARISREAAESFQRGGPYDYGRE